MSSSKLLEALNKRGVLEESVYDNIADALNGETVSILYKFDKNGQPVAEKKQVTFTPESKLKAAIMKGRLLNLEFTDNIEKIDEETTKLLREDNAAKDTFRPEFDKGIIAIKRLQTSIKTEDQS